MVASFKNDFIKITLVSKDDEYYLLRLVELVYNEYSSRNQEETTYFLCDQMSGLKNATEEIESRYLLQKRIQSDDL